MGKWPRDNKEANHQGADKYNAWQDTVVYGMHLKSGDKMKQAVAGDGANFEIEED